MASAAVLALLNARVVIATVVDDDGENDNRCPVGGTDKPKLCHPYHDDEYPWKRNYITAYRSVTPLDSVMTEVHNTTV